MGVKLFLTFAKGVMDFQSVKCASVVRRRQLRRTSSVQRSLSGISVRAPHRGNRTSKETKHQEDAASYENNLQDVIEDERSRSRITAKWSRTRRTHEQGVGNPRQHLRTELRMPEANTGELGEKLTIRRWERRAQITQESTHRDKTNAKYLCFFVLLCIVTCSQ